MSRKEKKEEEEEHEDAVVRLTRQIAEWLVKLDMSKRAARPGPARAR
jgi:hypothetical protein